MNLRFSMFAVCAALDSWVWIRRPAAIPRFLETGRKSSAIRLGWPASEPQITVLSHHAQQFLYVGTWIWTLNCWAFSLALWKFLTRAVKCDLLVVLDLISGRGALCWGFHSVRVAEPLLTSESRSFLYVGLICIVGYLGKGMGFVQ